MKSLRGSLVPLGLALWVVLPVGLFLLVHAAAGQARVAEPAQTWVPVEQTTTEVARSVGVLMQWESGGSVVAPDWEGVIQRVTAGAGEPVTSGDVVATIAGVDRLAVHTPVPFSTRLVPGDTGVEVEQLNDVLATQDLPHTPGEEFTEATATGVTRLAESLGARTGEKPEFDPGWVVYLPAATAVLDTVELTVGAPAPAPGTVVATVQIQLVAAQLTTTETAEAANRESTSQGQGGVAAPGASPVAGEAVEAVAEERLLVGSTELALDTSRDTVTEEALDTLAGEVVAGSASTPARLVRPAGAEEFVVPAAAVYAGDNGALCVLATTTSSEEATPVPVSTVGAEAGQTVVNGQLSAGLQVLLSPPAERRQCG